METTHPQVTDEFLISQGFSLTFRERFWAKVQITDGCWLWTAGRNKGGYGQIGKGGRIAGPILAHVASWILHYGQIPGGLFVLHHCDNPPCVRPDHLWLGTIKDNVDDSIAKGRSSPPPINDNRGERHGMHKLTELAVIQIRELYQPGIVRQQDIADMFGVSRRCVAMVIHNQRWKHIPVSA